MYKIYTKNFRNAIGIGARAFIHVYIYIYIYIYLRKLGYPEDLDRKFALLKHKWF